MSTRVLRLICLTGSLIGTTALAQQTDPVPERQPAPEIRTVAAQRAAPERTEPARPDEALAAGVDAVPADSVAGSLQTIVVLCATQPASKAFETAWARYVQTHAVAEKDLDALIDQVLARAEAYRAEHSSNPRSIRAAANPATTRAAMHETAKAAIRNFR